MMDFSGGSMDPASADSVSDTFDTPVYTSSHTVISPAPEMTSTQRFAKTLKNAPYRPMPVPEVIVDDKYDALLTPFGMSTLKDRYLTEDETPQDRFANCVRYYANDSAHAQRMYEYIAKQWCIGATPITSNGGTLKGNLISCFLNDMPDSLRGIVDTWNENIWMGAKGGGIGTYIGGLRSIGEKVGHKGKTSGAISFARVMDALVATISQAGNRRGAGAVYMDINHPEIEDFIDMRREAGGDPNRKTPNLFHGVCIPDAFMEAVDANTDWEPNWPLIDPHTKQETGRVSARELAIKLVTARLDTGTPYILFSDRIKEATPEYHQKQGLIPKTSNLCVEITLPTGKDHHGIDRTAVCALFQVNIVKWDEWKDHPTFHKDIAYFMDNVLQDFIDNAGEDFINARYSASRERSIGVGMMGFHSFLQSKGLAFEGVMAKVWNKKIFAYHKKMMDQASREIAEERGPCPDAAEYGVMERFSYKIALAPTASVSIICGGVSAGGDATPANVFTQKTLDGSFEVRNPYLEKILIDLGKNTPEIWNSILKNNGSVAHLDFLDEDTKMVYRTSFEIDQRWNLELAADRQKYICQSQSLNIAMAPDCYKEELWKIHRRAWELGIKSLYYLRSYSIQRADNSDGTVSTVASADAKPIDYSECLSCQ